MATEIAVMEHRLQALEQIPPRLNVLENEVVGVKNELHMARAEISTISSQGILNTRLLGSQEAKISHLFWTGAGVILACTVIGSVAALAISIVKSGMFP